MKSKEIDPMNLSRWTVLGLALLVIIFGCKSKVKPESPFVTTSISENEDKGIKEILQVYGGKCEYSVGFQDNSIHGRTDYFELKVSGSEKIEANYKVAHIPASNIAYTFYHNLTDERQKYDKIQVVILFKNKVSKSFEFSTEDLDLVERKMEIVEDMIELLKNQEYLTVKTKLKPDTSIFKYDDDRLISDMSEADKEWGQISKFIPRGFYFKEYPTGRTILHILGVLERNSGKGEFSIDIDSKADCNDILLIRYQF